MTRIEALRDFIGSLEYPAKVWRDQRVYINGIGRDISAYFLVDDPLGEYDPSAILGPLTGASLHVFSNARNSDPQWKVNRAKQIKHEIMKRMAEARGLQVSGNWRDVIL